jgi:hypothetical protein
MRSIASASVLTGFVLILHASRLSAATPTVACELITQARVSAALGVPVDAGKPIARPGTCQWFGKGKFATLTITLTKGDKTPVDSFNAEKTSKLAGVTAEPVSGVGDDAYYIYFSGTTRAGVGIVVKKGTSSFEIRVYGFPLDVGKTVGKTLALDAASKF